MTTTNSVKVVFHNGQTATEPLPVFDRDEIKSMTFILGWTSVVLSKTSPSAVEVVVHQLDQQQPPPPSAVEVVVHQLDQQQPPPPPPPPPPASEEENITEIEENKEMPPPASEEENKTEPEVPDKGINHEKPEQRAFSLMIGPDTRNLIMVLATLFLQMAYQAGLNPPGGFWSDDLSAAAARSSAMAASSLAPAPLGGENGGDTVVPHQAGDPILRSEKRLAYFGFEFLNSLSLSCSSLLILILMALSFVRNREWSNLGLHAAMGIMSMDLMIILAAYNVGAATPDNRIVSLIPYVAVVVAYIILCTVYFVERKAAK